MPDTSDATPVAVLRDIIRNGQEYEALVFWCPGCQYLDGSGAPRGGLHMLPVNSTSVSPQWDWDGDLDAPTLSPSILTRATRHGPGGDVEFVCHSFLRGGVWEFLSDCTHELAGQHVPMAPLPDWVLE